MLNDDDKDFYEERAAIIEFEAKETKVKAEFEAYKLLMEKKAREQQAKMGFG